MSASNDNLNVMGPWDEIVEITPSDSDMFAAYDALFIENEGTIKFRPVVGQPVTVTIVLAHTILPFRATMVYATGSTATKIFGLRKKRYINPKERGQKYIVGTTGD